MADILVVDDDPLVKDLIVTVLEGAGHSVRSAETGLNGIKEIRRKAPDLILLDMNMPEMDGYATAKALRSGVVGKMVPILAVTAHKAPEDYDAAYEAGCTGFLGKPIDPDRLLEAVNKQLDGK